MGGPPGGGDPELRWLLSNMGFRRGVNPSAPRAVDVLLHLLDGSCSGFLYHSQHRFWRAELHLLSGDHCGHHEEGRGGGRGSSWNLLLFKLSCPGLGFLGISGAIVIQVYDTFCKGQPSAFLLILALLPTSVSLVLMFFVKIYDKANTSDDKKHLNGFTTVALIIAVYLMILIILENVFTLPSWARIFTFTLLLLVLASPLGIAIKAMDPVAYHELPGGESAEVNAALDDTTPPDEESMNLLQAMCTVNFWLLFIAAVCGMGSGLAVINNFTQIGESLDYATVEITSLVSLWSIWSFFGRLGAGYLSDYLLHTRGWARPVLMAITLAGMAVGHFLIAFGFPGILYVGSILVGICYGSQWSLMPTIAADIYGVRHLGTIINTLGIAIPLGSYISSVRVIGYFYEKEASGEDDSCFGTHCFMLSFLIMASVVFLGFLAAIALFFRTKSFYQQVVPKRLKNSVT
ncbi:uncharacterized protein LOC133874666 isoform X2 [Alnus glutinosa]|uniref:uncharacterized protein LOC133874666 isoform X2 n=1 Tax=Alnus glutinosa TaxID=3517 RepID=UPI002D79250A|nr:uncharacterized protein LOC133874666 isoform X2 [Alnus glutinosa]